MMVNDVFSSSVRSLVLGHHHCTRTRLGGTRQWLKTLGALPSAMATRWRSDETLSIIPMNSLFAGDGIVRCATRWLTVAAALRRPNGSAVGSLRAECSGERVRRRGSPLDD